VAVGGTTRDNVASMIEGLRAAYNELRVERVDDWTSHIVRKREVPALGAVRIQSVQLGQILHKIMNAIGTNVGLRKDVVGVRCRKGPQLTTNGRVRRENRVHAAIRPNGRLHAGIKLC